MYPHINEINPATRFYGKKSQGNLHCAPPLPIPRSWERCLPITLNCPPVQSLHNTTVNFTVHASVNFLINGDKRPLLVVCFLKRLETSPFRWRRFCRCAINRLGHAVNTKHFYEWRSDFKDLFGLQLCGCDVLLGKLWRNFLLLHVFRARAEHFQSKSAYFYLSNRQNASKSGFGKFRHKSFSYSQGRSERLCLFVVVVSRMTESGTFERLPVFLESPIDFDDFLEQIR